MSERRKLKITDNYLNLIAIRRKVCTHDWAEAIKVSNKEILGD